MLKLIYSLLTFLFLISCYLGYYLAETYPEVTKREMKNLEEFFRSFAQAKLSFIEIFALIFINNSVKSFFAMLLGIFFGIVPVLFLFLNGLIIGLFAKFIGEKIGLLKFILLLLPHGILEIPAVILACSYGFQLGVEFARNRKGIVKHVKKAVKNFFKFVIPMLLVAA
ncbi:MAG: stage II sporulation protein M, partial [Archaeoglobaceae archaeon]